MRRRGWGSDPAGRCSARAGPASAVDPPSVFNGVTPMPRRKVRRPWLDYLVYLFVRTIVSFAQMLTIEQSYALAAFAAWIVYQVDARHRKVGCANLELA